MKKLKSLLLLMLVCVMTCFCFLFTGCSPEGTYKFDSLKYEDGKNAITVEIGDKFEGTELKKDSFILIVNKDNTFAFRVTETEVDDDGKVEETNTEVSTGTWMEGYNDEFYCTTADGDSFVAKKDGNKITFEFYGMELTLKK